MAQIKKSDTKVFTTPEPKTVTTVTGETITLAPVTLGKELAISELLSDVFVKVVQSGAFSQSQGDGNTDPDVVAKVIEVLFREAPHKMADAASILLDKADDAQWVLDNLNSTAVVQLVIPFLQHRLSDLAQSMRGILPTVPSGMIADAMKTLGRN